MAFSKVLFTSSKWAAACVTSGVGVTVLAALLLAGAYNWRAFKNMATQEAMDAAQLARNIAQGKGYTTSSSAPSACTWSRSATRRRPRWRRSARSRRSLAELKSGHPDLANPPVYPLVLAGLMKVLPFRFDISSKPLPFWFKDGRFRIYEPDFLITVVNQLILLAVVLLVFLLAQRLFDRTIAWTSAVVIVGTELLWRFTASGLSTMLLMLIFTILVWILLLLEEETREPKGGSWRLLVLAITAGLLVGLGALTRYSFGWLIIPVVVFVAVVTGLRQAPGTAAAVFLAFTLTLAPWVTRNFVKSGTPFGTATYSLIDGENIFPDHGLQRSLTNDVKLGVRLFKISFYKTIMNGRRVLGGDLPQMSGSWVSAFFLVGLLVSPPAPSVRRLRHFLLGSVVLLLLAQAMGQTQLSQDSPEINSENLLVLLAPLIAVYGVSFFYLLLEHVDLPFREARYVATGIFLLIACLPLVLKLLPPPTNPIVSPYFPPGLQGIGTLTKTNDLTVSDIPWAMAWYGQRNSVWLPVKMEPDFFEIHQEKPIETLHLSRKELEKLDSRDLSHFHQTGEPTWGFLILRCLEAFPLGTQSQSWPKVINPVAMFPNHKPMIFPLRYWQFGWPEQLVLTSQGFTPQQWLLFQGGSGPVSAQTAENYFRQMRSVGR